MHGPAQSKHKATMRSILESGDPDDVKVKGMKGIISVLLDETAELGTELKNTTRVNQVAEAELSKSMKVKKRLEALCRELQVQNKDLVVSQKQLSADECQKRADIGSQFGDQIKDIQVRMEEQNTERMKVHEENVDLRTKLNDFLEQYDTTQKQWETQLKGADLEKQLLQAKLDQATALYEQEQQKTVIYEKQCTELMQTELELRVRVTEFAFPSGFYSAVLFLFHRNS